MCEGPSHFGLVDANAQFVSYEGCRYNVTSTTRHGDTGCLDHVGDICPLTEFTPIKTKPCPRDCEGEWTGGCTVASHLSCDDLTIGCCIRAKALRFPLWGAPRQALTMVLPSD